MTKISIVVPVYNEKNYIRQVLDRLEKVSFSSLDKEIIIVDDGSTDGTKEILESFEDSFKVIYHNKNCGKGAALKTGFKNSSGEIIVIQDADLEYNPSEIKDLIQSIVKGEVSVVYGSRMNGNNPIGHRRYYLGNLLISWVTNLLYGSKLSDVETCYKVFDRKVLDKINLEQNDFGFEAEFTAKVLKNHFSIREIPISYSPRNFTEGKKINWYDGLKAIFLLIKYRFS
ncbi:MAG: glycosyl transferase [Candidatus Buchananbacteria bacterium RIFCSPHIGHO2_02_FULL_38_8]|uniref:Glycosyl transferase n=1 Tax=Candidatus Buchananbacteria bacterium RIFCSPHIGHO2_02_FULL_38_8 TaxID=1797538 RepID=A0A1G1Y630_9BACT|nr:MAG: glycosyl transferase [Candidatus Buchananbacteria bacterium RIFCSPHIGHO2_02_FULL_38_8]